MVTFQLIPGLVTLGRVSLTRVSGSSVSSPSLEAAGGLAYGLCKQDTFESFHRGSE